MPGKIADRQTLMLFDLSVYGHHATYIQYLIRYWQQEQIEHKLVIVVSPRFLSIHHDVVELANVGAQGDIRFVAITEAEEAQLPSRRSSLNRNLRNWSEWQLHCRYAKNLEVTQSLIMYIDTYQLLLAFGQSSPCPFSGIYFRPTFHYSELGNPPTGFKARVQRQWEYFSIMRVLQNPQLQQLFSLDSFAVDYLKKRDPQAKISQLADPVEVTIPATLDTAHFKQTLGIESHRKVGILMGALTRRKGIYPLLNAIKELSPEQCEQFCLLLVGAASPTEMEKIKLVVADVLDSCPVQIISRYEFIPEEEIPTYFEISDFALALYQRHVGMSGIILLAAAAQKPVLSTNYGLMGKLVNQYRLGMTVDSANSKEISYALTQLLTSDITSTYDETLMMKFSEKNAWQNFSKTLLSLLQPSAAL
ncbi:MAG: glycosyltransferase [Cyanobacteria bacterium P01_D01_bin.156]